MAFSTTGDEAECEGTGISATTKELLRLRRVSGLISPPSSAGVSGAGLRNSQLRTFWGSDVSTLFFFGYK